MDSYGAKGETGEHLGVWLQRILGFREKRCHLEPKCLGRAWKLGAAPKVM